MSLKIERMKRHLAVLLCLFFVISLICPIVLGDHQLAYRVRIEIDGSAAWVIEERFLTGESPQPSPQMFDTFINNVKSLVDSAEQIAERDMFAESFAMTVNVSGSYTIVKYQFRWLAFAQINTSRIMIGDVFEVAGLFLLGEGTVNVEYPTNYVVESVSPQPHAQSARTLTWWGIQDFKLGEPNVVFVEHGTLDIISVLRENAPLILGTVVLAGIGVTGLYHFRFRKKSRKEKPIDEYSMLPRDLDAEDNEEKILNLLKAAGGRLPQSVIARQCKFSKAKTSILLAKMEKSGTVKRYEKGREKVVVLSEDGNSKG